MGVSVEAAGRPFHATLLGDQVALVVLGPGDVAPASALVGIPEADDAVLVPAKCRESVAEEVIPAAGLSHAVVVVGKDEVRDGDSVDQIGLALDRIADLAVVKYDPLRAGGMRASHQRVELGVGDQLEGLVREFVGPGEPGDGFLRQRRQIGEDVGLGKAGRAPVVIVAVRGDPNDRVRGGLSGLAVGEAERGTEVPVRLEILRDLAVDRANGGEDVFLGNLGVVLDRNDPRASLGRRGADMILDAVNMFFFLALR